VFVVIRIIAAFPVVTYGENKMLLFSAERLVLIDPLSELIRPKWPFKGRVLGSHVLETEYGRITLNNSALIMADYSRVIEIDVKNFEEGRAFHNLVIEEIKVPPNISVFFPDNYFYDTQRSPINIHMYEDQTVDIQGIPFSIENIYINNPRYAGDIVISGSARPPQITLADTTEIDTTQFSGRLHIYKDKEQWALVSANSDVFLLVKLPGETEFTKYKSLTFGKEWGAVIEEELWEE
jgi:hypothetical protein